MSRRNYTREILSQVRAGKVPVNSVGPGSVVWLAARSKNDPKPWTDGTFRYSGREIDTEDGCRKSINGTVDRCGLQAEHRHDCRRIAAYIHYTYS